MREPEAEARTANQREPKPDERVIQRYKIARRLILWEFCEFESATGSVLSTHRYGSAGWKVTKVTTSKSPCYGLVPR
jgi:hypothetical protein